MNAPLSHLHYKVDKLYKLFKCFYLSFKNFIIMFTYRNVENHGTSIVWESACSIVIALDGRQTACILCLSALLFHLLRCCFCELL